MQACILCKLAWLSLSLATTTTSSISARCAQRPRPSQPALHLLPRYMCRSAAYMMRMLGLALDPCLHMCSLCILRACSLGAQAEFDKGHSRVRAFGGVFASAVVKEVQTLVCVVVGPDLTPVQCTCVDRYHSTYMSSRNPSQCHVSC